jgi:hypothetical protein
MHTSVLFSCKYFERTPNEHSWAAHLFSFLFSSFFLFFLFFFTSFNVFFVFSSYHRFKAEKPVKLTAVVTKLVLYSPQWKAPTRENARFWGLPQARGCALMLLALLHGVCFPQYHGTRVLNRVLNNDLISTSRTRTPVREQQTGNAGLLG